MVPVLEVACIKWGRKYGPEYVNRLMRAVSRYLSIPHRFVCYTDDPAGLLCEVAALPAGYAGWWNKLFLFSLNRRILLLDLDSVILGPLDAMVTPHFCTIKDPWQKGYNSSAVMIQPDMQFVWGEFVRLRPDKRLHGDQDWLNEVPGFYEELCFPIGVCLSYKAHIKKLPGRTPPADCSMVYFHGIPKPHEVRDPFVLTHWHEIPGE